MTLEEAQKMILELQEENKQIAGERDKYKELSEGFKTKEETYKTEAGKYKERIEKLQELNTDLFLKVAQSDEGEGKKEEEKEEEIEIKSLDELLEG